MEMANAKVGDRSYRCFFTPKDGLGHLAPSDTGAQPFVQLSPAARSPTSSASNTPPDASA